MKIIIMIIAMFTVTSVVFSQDWEPSNQLLFDYYQCNDCTVSSDVLQQQGFLLGWHWNFGKRMSDALEMSQAHFNQPPSGYDHTSFNNPSDLIIYTMNFSGTASVSSNGHAPSIMEAQAVQYEPTLLTNGTFTEWEDSDEVRSVFGYEDIDGEAIYSGDKRLVLLTGENYESATEPVLSNPWINGVLKQFSSSGH